MTVSVNTSGRLVGLHVDSYEDASIEKRELKRNRLCVNVGTESRFFLFVNLTLRQMLQAMDLPSGLMSAHSIGYEFMQTFPSYPVIRLRLQPGEGYVAPVENCVHDGSTLEMTVCDYHVALDGFFAV